MGAELILTACPVPLAAYGERLDPSQQRAVLLARIHRLDDAVLGFIADYSLGIESDDDTWRQQVRDYLVAALELFDDDHRDTTMFTFGEREWLFSGGLSWGDVPCDSYDPLAALATAQISVAPLRAAELSSTSAEATPGKE